MDKKKLIEKLKERITPIEPTSNGLLRGGFATSFSGIDMDEDCFPPTPEVPESKLNIGCIGNGLCQNNVTCFNNGTCSFNGPCHGNQSCYGNPNCVNMACQIMPFGGSSLLESGSF